jgi:hypothetical protein
MRFLMVKCNENRKDYARLLHVCYQIESYN